MNQLPNDYTRCYGYLCRKKRECKRFTTIAIDESKLLSYVNSMIDEQGDCENFIADDDQSSKT